MEPTRELIDALYRDKVLQARRTPPEVKLLDAARLFDAACEVARGGIRADNPGATDGEVRRELLRRMAIARRLEATAYEVSP